MARWRAAALSPLPTLRQAIDTTSTVKALWCDLSPACQVAYEQSPPDEVLIAAIFSYADWCASARRHPAADRDPMTAVGVCFYEDLPLHAAAREDMPRWFTPVDIVEWKSLFVYTLGEAGYRDVRAHIQVNRNRYVARPRADQRGSTRIQ